MADRIIQEFLHCINVGASKTTEIKTHTIQYNDGYQTDFSIGINNTRKSWSCSKTDTKEVIDEIEAFIVAHKNIYPFYMTIAGDKDLYKVVGGLNTNHEDANYWTISFNIRQVFKP